MNQGIAQKPVFAWLDEVEVFSVGMTEKGTARERIWTRADLDDMVNNFELGFTRRFAAGARPIYSPMAKIGHEADQRTDYPACGWIKRLWHDGRTLFADFGEVPFSTANWIAERKYRFCSAEILDQPPPGLQAYGMRGPWLKGVAFLGAAPPEKKDLAEIPMPRWDLSPHTFAAKLSLKPVRMAAPVVRRTGQTTYYFSERIFSMDPLTETPSTPSPERQAAIDSLAQMGIDTSTITDAVPDAFLISLVAFLQQMQSQSTTPPPDMTAASQRSTPKKVTLAYADNWAIRALQAQVEEMNRRLNDQNSVAHRQADQSKKITVRQFCDQAVREGKMTPAENDETSPFSLRSVMLGADNTRQYSFSQGGKAMQATQLEQMMNMVKARQEYKFSERAYGGAAAGIAGGVKPHIASARAAAERRYGRRLSNAGSKN